MRVKKLQKTLEKGVCAIIQNPVNRFYLSGFRSSAGMIVLTDSKAVLFVDFRYFEKAKKTVHNMDVVLANNFLANAKELLNGEKIKKILLETDFVNLDSFERMKKAFEGIEVSADNSLSQTISSLRQIKSVEETECIKKSQGITDNAFTHILNFIKEGVTEQEIALELEFFMRKSGSEGVAFDTIAVSGKNSSLPHGVPTDKPLEKGDFLTMDFGAVFGGYCSDMTRTVAIGFVTDEQQKVYDTVLNAQLKALDNIGPNKVCKEIDKIARDIINKEFEGCFGHGLGHSVGLEIHENPALNTRDETLLKAGVIMTVEPGIYIPDKFGVRIEDMVLITDTSYENLTKSPKELIII